MSAEDEREELTEYAAALKEELGAVGERLQELEKSKLRKVTVLADSFRRS